ncbi:hypothetical protein [Nocardioides massiliensis]|uniref:Type IV pilus biogenesis protein CpaD/CtpE n=1 Tax=Nocardioides massiliensis TaxID=1325935 RepID=A0ABT9NKY7_9ACTN|nr:hypothetical protein [Nocardioides massiliensis]MDP9821068.1 type IV pilus biogenesis protein CpaD/CtpE [Nocardioides massiliensis]
MSKRGKRLNRERRAAYERQAPLGADRVHEEVAEVLDILLAQKREGLERGETEPFKRWLAELEAASAISRHVVIPGHGTYSSRVVAEVVRELRL